MLIPVPLIRIVLKLFYKQMNDSCWLQIMLLSKQLRALTLHLSCILSLQWVNSQYSYNNISRDFQTYHIILLILRHWEGRLSYKYQMLLFHKLLFILVEPLIGTSWKRTPHYKGHLSCPILILYYPSTKDTSIKRTMVSIIEGFHCIWIIKPRLYPNHYINHLPTHSYEIPCIIMY